MNDNSGKFRHFPMAGECPDCGSFETMYVGEQLIDEQCCWCGRIVGGGYERDAPGLED